MNQDPALGFRNLGRVWDGIASVDEHAALEFFLLALLASRGREGVADWVREFPEDFAKETDLTGIDPDFSIRFMRSDRPPLVIAGCAHVEMSWVDVNVELPPVAVSEQDPRHAAFYSIWERVSASEFDAPRNDAERAVFLIGLLEAEVMNGGLGQYLTNTDGAHVTETLACLDKIGASKTAALLLAAVELASGAESFAAAWDDESERFARLDGAFLESGEDLAARTAEAFLA